MEKKFKASRGASSSDADPGGKTDAPPRGRGRPARTFVAAPRPGPYDARRAEFFGQCAAGSIWPAGQEPAELRAARGAHAEAKERRASVASLAAAEAWLKKLAPQKEEAIVVKPLCVCCDEPASREFGIHRDAMGEGPEMCLCEECGGYSTPTCEDIWALIAARLAAGELLPAHYYCTSEAT